MVEKIKTAMLVDDDKIAHRLYERVSARSELIETFLAFEYAEKALDYVLDEANPPVDLIFLDINMPRMNGFEFLETLLAKKPDLQSVVIFMLTTSLDPTDRERANSFDVVKDFLNKPLTVDDVRKAATLIAESKG